MGNNANRTPQGWHVTENRHGTADGRGIYLPAFGEEGDRVLLIEWSAIDEPTKLLRATRRLSMQSWFTREICSAFLAIVFQHFGWPK